MSMRQNHTFVPASAAISAARTPVVSDERPDGPAPQQSPFWERARRHAGLHMPSAKTTLKKTAIAALMVAASLAVGKPTTRTAHLAPTEALAARTAPVTAAEGEKLLRVQPVAFVPNLGQWDCDAHHVARFGPMTAFLQDKGWTFTLGERARDANPSSSAVAAWAGRDPKPPAPGRGVAVRMTFEGALQPDLVSENQLPGRHNYFLGAAACTWRSEVPLYRSVCYRQLYGGVDVRVREHDRHMEYDLMLAPDAQLESIQVAVDGIQHMHIEPDGALVMETELGPIRMPVPLTWEEGPSGERSPALCRYVLRGENCFGFEVPGRQTGWMLTVDPGLIYSTLLGGSGDDYGYALAVDAQGAATVAGYTTSSNFPTTSGAFDTTYNGGSYDAFVVRLTPNGSNLVYATFLGGTMNDFALSLAVDAQGWATVGGNSGSTDFPTTPGAYDTTYNGGQTDAFVIKLSPTGTSLAYSTFLGGTSDDAVTALALDAQGAVTVAGPTQSSNFPTTSGAFDTSANGGEDAFVTKLTPTGSGLVYSTFLGGANFDRPYALALDAQGTTIVGGSTYSANFPTTPGAFDTSANGGEDAFVTRIVGTGSGLVYSTLLGGTSDDRLHTLAVDAQGAATVAGFTMSNNFPTTPGAFDTTYNGGFAGDAFVTKLTPPGSSLDYSTFLGGGSSDAAYAVALDAQNAATIAGVTLSANYPTTPGAFDTTYNGGYLGDVFVTRLSPIGSTLVYSTFLGGLATDYPQTLALDAYGSATVTGYTTYAGSSGFPTTPGAFDTSHNGGQDAFVTRLDMLPTGVSAFGQSSPGCAGPLPVSVNSMPRVGNAGFALNCGNAAPSTTGLLAYSTQGLTAPSQLVGVDLWVNPASVLATQLIASNGIGASEAPLPIPNNPGLAGVRLFAQFVWLGPTAPPPCPPLGVSASNALDFTIQP